MRKQSGNFLLQALLALTLVFAFMPFFANKLSSRDMQARLYSTTNQVETLYNVARIYVREERDNISISNEEQVYSANSNPSLHRLLEEYGLPIGFNTQTIFNQDMSFHIKKTSADDVHAYILLSGVSSLKNVDLVALQRMIGSNATVDTTNKTLSINVPVEEIYSDIVLRYSPEDQYFLVNLDMGGYDILGNGYLLAESGYFGDGNEIGTLTVRGSGSEGEGDSCVGTRSGDIDSRNVVNKIDGGIYIEKEAKSLFLSATDSSCRYGDALYLSKQGAELNLLSDSTASLNSIGPRATEDGPIINVTGGARINGDFTVDGTLASGAEWTISGNVKKIGLDTYVLFENVGGVVSDGTIFASANKAGDATPEVVGETGIYVETLSANSVAAHSKQYGEIYGSGVGVSRSSDVSIDLTNTGISKIDDVHILGYKSAGENVPIDNSLINIVTDPHHTNIYPNGVFQNGNYSTESCAKMMSFYTSFYPGAKLSYSQNSLIVHIICQYLFWDRMDRLLNYRKCQKFGDCA